MVNSFLRHNIVFAISIWVLLLFVFGVSHINLLVFLDVNLAFHILYCAAVFGEIKFIYFIYVIYVLGL